MTGWPVGNPYLSPEQQLSFKTTSTGTRRIVTQRDDDLLTPAEVRDRWPEVEAAMLKELDCSYVIVGHSERRQYHQETDEQVAEKALQVLDSDMIPVICVGESADERNSGREVEVVRGQISKQVAILQDRLADCLIAYEPVWAIGTGKVASAQIAQDMHRAIRLQLAEFDEDVASHVGILYGGSVKPDNAVELFAMPDIDGGLIGGASLNPQDFLAICQA